MLACRVKPSARKQFPVGFLDRLNPKTLAKVGANTLPSPATSLRISSQKKAHQNSNIYKPTAPKPVNLNLKMLIFPLRRRNPRFGSHVLKLLFDTHSRAIHGSGSMGLRVWALGFMGLGFRTLGSGSMGLGFRVCTVNPPYRKISCNCPCSGCLGQGKDQ